MVSSTHDQRLTEALAVRVMGWRVGPDRFIKSGRNWIPRWRFQPLINIEHAFQLLEMAAKTFTLATTPDGTFTARVRVGDQYGSASGEPKATSIALAVARALGLETPDDAVSRSPAYPGRKAAGGK